MSSCRKKKAVVIGVLTAVNLSAIAAEPIPAFRFSTADADGWAIEKRWETESADVDILTVTGAADSPRRSPSVRVSLAWPAADVQSLWRLDWFAPTYIPHAFGSSMACWTPICAYRGSDDSNRLLLACSDAFSEFSCRMDVDEANAAHRTTVAWKSLRSAPCRAFAVSFRFDRRNVPGYAAVREASDWISSRSGYVPLAAPPAAFGPVYSTWYAFHQNVTAERVEAACRKASAMGMRTLILDDGWQTEDTRRGYAFCGDWRPAPSKFPDMAAHVKRVHGMGMKYVLWYAIPFVGCKSAAYARFSGKFIGTSFKGRVGVLDPRLPEVREYIVGFLENAMREWDVDGFKIDFIGRWLLDGTAVKADFDKTGLMEGVETLMAEIVRRLSAIKPEPLIEFRQQYVGNAMCRFGNMLRVSDCASKTVLNRSGIASMRLVTPQSAVHSDMIGFNPAESPESSARHVLDSIFGVVQYSPDFSRITPGQERMLAHWVKFSLEHEDALLHGAFRPEGSAHGYPALEGSSETETVRVVYLPGQFSTDDGSRSRYIVANATGAEGLVVDCRRAGSFMIRDTFGDEVASGRIGPGIRRFPVPNGGLVEIAGVPAVD